KFHEVRTVTLKIESLGDDSTSAVPANETDIGPEEKDGEGMTAMLAGKPLSCVVNELTTRLPACISKGFEPPVSAVRAFWRIDKGIIAVMRFELAMKLEFSKLGNLS
ncbi:hypothetical protein C0989_009451, partial [Termitomyces sp. Mn162]